MLLFALWIRTAQRPERSVIFKAAIDLLRDRIGDFEVGRELKAPLRARSIESALDRIWSAPAESSDDGAFDRLYSPRWSVTPASRKTGRKIWANFWNREPAPRRIKRLCSLRQTGDASLTLNLTAQ